MIHDTKSGDIRICFFGDSLVNGIGDPKCLGWTGRVCADARGKGHDVTHYNLGIRGETSADIASRWRVESSRRLLVRYRTVKPMVVFSYGINDIRLTNGKPRVPFEQTIANTARILSEAKELFPVFMIGPPPIADAAREIKKLSDEFTSICEEAKVPFLDVFDRLRASQVWMDEIAARDGAHPGASGYAVLAQMVRSWPSWRAWFDRLTTNGM